MCELLWICLPYAATHVCACFLQVLLQNFKGNKMPLVFLFLIRRYCHPINLQVFPFDITKYLLQGKHFPLVHRAHPYIFGVRRISRMGKNKVLIENRTFYFFAHLTSQKTELDVHVPVSYRTGQDQLSPSVYQPNTLWET